MKKELTGYDLSRQWFAFLWDNPSKVTANDTALYFFLCQLWNQLGQPNEFQVTAKECQTGMSANSYNTFKKSFDKLKEMGCLKLIKQSTNQYQCNVIALSKIDIAEYKALNKAMYKASDTFIKPLTINLKPIIIKENIPEQNIFLDYCKEVLNEKYLPLEFSLKAKYETWAADGWIDGNGKKIKNWKTKIKNTIPFLKPLHGNKYEPEKPKILFTIIPQKS